MLLFSTLLSIRKAFNSNPIMNLWNVLHATLLTSVVAPATQKQKISNLNQNDASVTKVFDCYCLCRLKTLCFCRLCLSTLLSVLLCTLQYLTALAFLTLISDCINPADSSRYYVLWAPIARCDPWDKTSRWNLPNFSLSGTITSHHPTSHLEVCHHVIPLPTWLEISPYWRSLHKWMRPLNLLLASPVVVAPQPPKAASPIVAPP